MFNKIVISVSLNLYLTNFDSSMREKTKIKNDLVKESLSFLFNCIDITFNKISKLLNIFSAITASFSERQF